MNEQTSFERLVADRIAERGVTPTPSPVIDELLARASKTRQRPGWLALIKEPPMRVSDRLGVGSPTSRLAASAMATLLLAVMATGVVVGSASLLAGTGVHVVDPGDPGAYATISDAVAAAQDGETVLVKPGVYPETVLIERDITLRGDGPRDQIVIEIKPDGPTFDTESGPAVHGLMIRDSLADISELTVRVSADIDPEAVVLGVVLDGGAPSVHGVTTDDGVDGAIWAMNSAKGRVTDSTLRGIVFLNSRSSTAVERNEITWHVGVLNAGATEPAIVRENRTVGVTIDGPATVERNIVRLGDEPDTPNSDFLGITVRSGTGWFVLGNDVAGFVDAIDIRSGAFGIVQGNTLTENTTGIRATGSFAIIDDNTIEGGSDGIVIASFGIPSIRGNTVTGAAISGISVGRGTQPVISGNTLCGNGTDLIVAEGAVPALEDNQICPS